MPRKSTRLAGICALVLGYAMVAGAQAPNVTGIWDITMGTIVRTLTLQQDGNKVSGTMKGPAGSFALEGRKIHRDYSGTVDGQTITGTINDGTNTNTFVAKPGPDRTYDPPAPAKP
jgi:hypothetical protein